MTAPPTGKPLQQHVVNASGQAVTGVSDRTTDSPRVLDVLTGVAAGNRAHAAGGKGTGDGGPATSARLKPADVAVDATGNLFIADSGHNRIRHVDAVTGIITTFAGGGAPADGLGDGGPATSARLSSPSGVAVDAMGNLFIADWGHHRIRRVDAATGKIKTVAGNGIRTFGGDGGPATSASLFFPTGVAVDATGNLFIAESHNLRVRRVDAPTGIITTFAGGGAPADGLGDGGPATSARLSYTGGVAIDATGNVFIADLNNQRIRRVEAATGIITTVAGNGMPGFGGDGGPATSARLRLIYAVGVATDASGNLFIADGGNRRIRRLNAETGIITTVAGSGPTAGVLGNDGLPMSASPDGPGGMAADGTGDLFRMGDMLIRAVRIAPR